MFVISKHTKIALLVILILGSSGCQKSPSEAEKRTLSLAEQNVYNVLEKLFECRDEDEGPRALIYETPTSPENFLDYSVIYNAIVVEKFSSSYPPKVACEHGWSSRGHYVSCKSSVQFQEVSQLRTQDSYPYGTALSGRSFVPMRWKDDRKDDLKMYLSALQSYSGIRFDDPPEQLKVQCLKGDDPREFLVNYEAALKDNAKNIASSKKEEAQRTLMKRELETGKSYVAALREVVFQGKKVLPDQNSALLFKLASRTYAKDLSKDEFESTAEFERRVDQYVKENAIDIVLTRSAKYEMDYDADKQSYNIRCLENPHVYSDTMRENYVGETRFGEKQSYTLTSGDEHFISVRCPEEKIRFEYGREQAKRDSGEIDAYFVYELKQGVKPDQKKSYREPRYGSSLAYNTMNYHHSAELVAVLLTKSNEVVDRKVYIE